MCVIAVSPKGIRQPNESDLHSMWTTNPHGGGYMVARNGRVEIHKGFMTWDEFIRSVRSEKFTKNDSVVYHFRIATQGGINPEMSHPFPITDKDKYLKGLDIYCPVGIAHNGIIPLTTTVNETTLSDTALFIKKYLINLIRCPQDIHNYNIQKMIEELGKSKFALMDSDGNIVTIGKFYDDNGIMLSNTNHWFDWTAYYTEYYAKGDKKKCTAF